MHIHLEGMGVNGSLLLPHLLQQGHEITWHDTEETVCAWKASTGAIYPSNSAKFGDDAACHARWAEWHESKLYGMAVEASRWWFNHKGRPPHEGKYQASAPTSHGLRCAENLHSYHLNSQALVTSTRQDNQGTRLAAAPAHCDLYIRTHGFGQRLSYTYWGWTMPVVLEYSDSIYGGGGKRPAFYFREGRFIMAYAYPVPGTDYWYAGSSIIKQKLEREKPLEIMPKYQKWRENFQRLSNGAVRIAARKDTPMQGWRPAAAKDDTAWATRNNRTIQLRPLWNSGIRHFPQQLDSVLALIAD